MLVLVVFDFLGLYWKCDFDFWLIKDKYIMCVNVVIGGGMVELLVIGLKWYDIRVEKGGGGVIDFVMYLLCLDFVLVVKWLDGGG